MTCVVISHARSAQSESCDICWDLPNAVLFPKTLSIRGRTSDLAKSTASSHFWSLHILLLTQNYRSWRSNVTNLDTNQSLHNATLFFGGSSSVSVILFNSISHVDRRDLAGRIALQIHPMQLPSFGYLHCPFLHSIDVSESSACVSRSDLKKSFPLWNYHMSIKKCFAVIVVVCNMRALCEPAMCVITWNSAWL